MKNKNNQLEAIAREVWQPASNEAENEAQFAGFLELLRDDIAAGVRGPRCASYRLGRKIIAAHLRSK
jgi:hypothetical protein